MPCPPCSTLLSSSERPSRILLRSLCKAGGFALDHVCSPCALVEYATHRTDDNREDKESFDGIDHDADPPSGVVSRANDKLHLNE